MACPCCPLPDDDQTLPADAVETLDLARKLAHAARSGVAGGAVVVVMLPDGHVAGVLQAGEVTREPGAVGRAATEILSHLSW
ncbi:hypothetical protein [Uliginosibacterium sp. 31-12]|uniref:hypothetical protein n=1 Tax=Uliginosibacterium sp. 31-12 TaxID=3062781 RepID=UPI0026E3E7EA|nr:hypothetical protein [Uliginosibacterium sp. 31-12]MDO6385610.1 hypothetical protein [Uliginosibacterium sp. 31-12]